uniref:Uncharacterized protein n=1 Tax=Podoviridae sp. ct8Lf7 TaxID=2827723 RepID=A0A8S5S092_9CAUD|nr:MAG TPA: hypothetical protein [Podoviridae sp. ct8Lf7]
MILHCIKLSYDLISVSSTCVFNSILKSTSLTLICISTITETSFYCTSYLIYTISNLISLSLIS